MTSGGLIKHQRWALKMGGWEEIRGKKGSGVATLGAPNACKAVIRARGKERAISAPVQGGHILRFFLRVQHMPQDNRPGPSQISQIPNSRG